MFTKAVDRASGKDTIGNHSARTRAPNLDILQPETRGLIGPRPNLSTEFKAGSRCTVIVAWILHAPKPCRPPTSCHDPGSGSDSKRRSGRPRNNTSDNRCRAGAGGSCANSSSGSCGAIAGNNIRNKAVVPTRFYQLLQNRKSSIVNKTASGSGRGSGSDNHGHGRCSVSDSDNGSGTQHNIPTYNRCSTTSDSASRARSSASSLAGYNTRIKDGVLTWTPEVEPNLTSASECKSGSGGDNRRYGLSSSSDNGSGRQHNIRTNNRDSTRHNDNGSISDSRNAKVPRWIQRPQQGWLP